MFQNLQNTKIQKLPMTPVWKPLNDLALILGWEASV